MKIFVLPVDKKFMPEKQNFLYPVGNDDYGVEQDFYKYLQNNNELITSCIDEADWCYLPIYWTRWQLNHDYGKLGLVELQKEVDRVLIQNRKSFTICQYDDGPIVNLGNTVQYLASRKTEKGEDIPLLAKSHKLPWINPRKKYLASFVGRIDTHNIRRQMSVELSGDSDYYIYDGNKGEKFFVDNTLKSYVSLCPRGYGGSSFRFFEAVQMGVVPFLIGDIDTRPFKDQINWEEISFFTKDVKEINKMLMNKSKAELMEMGKKAKAVYNEICYGEWCKFVLITLAKYEK